MLLKKIVLNNIRSYEYEEVDFTEGSTLLSGDIGSGKTSILLAIEFALFGLQPGQRGTALLKNGVKEGGVKIEFEVDGKTISIHRTLKRAKTVSQDFCSIDLGDGSGKQETSVTELKSKVLEVLNYPKEFSKKQNLLYKFTVYTPQEEMKQIILQDAETRINTLRHVFGIDKYKKILENVSLVASKIREEKRFSEALTSNLEQEKEHLILKHNELETKKQDLILIENDLLLKKESRKKIEEDQQEVSKKIQEKNTLQQEVEKTKLMIRTKEDYLTNNQKTIQQIKLQIQELQELEFDESKIISLESQITSLKNSKQQLNEKNIEISSQISSLTLKNSDNQTTISRISKLDSCPTCLQNVDSVYQANMQNKFESEVASNIIKIKELTLDKQKVVQELSGFEQQISEFQKQIQELQIMKMKLQSMDEKSKRLHELGDSQDTFTKDIALLNQHIDSLQKSVFELSKFENIFQEKQTQFQQAIKEEREADIKVAELKREIELSDKQIQELTIKLKETEKIQTKMHYLTSLENWLTTKFIPVISFIEKNVMAKLKSEFSNLFSEWFSMLVSDTFNVRLSDDFTPVIEQQDYEIDYAYLSGGERTAIALAYRLALNQVINSLLSKIKTRDFVILDEPTDGFSEQQLDKMRDVLGELNVNQLIIVSHEQKIEGFVENVIKFKKENGISSKDLGDINQQTL
jgi:DNA repair protein SbcC/Rad50